MKGLLIKDFKLLLGQKRFFVIVLGMGVMLMFTGGNPSSAIGYIVMLMTIFTLNTLSYDEHENGMNFLMTLPISRKTYVQEKLVYAGILAVGAGVVSVILASAATIMQGMELYLPEVIATAAVIAGMAMLMLAIMLPLQIKLGAEKGRMAMFAVAAVVGVVIALATKVIEKTGVNIDAAMAGIATIPPVKIAIGAIIILIAVLFVSYYVCVQIINKKEY